MHRLLLLVCLPLLIQSWWDVGHMLTAAIAEIRLNQLDIYASGNFRQVTLSINHLCDNRTRTFIESAVWADDIKGRQYNMDIWNQWHFIDTPHVTDATIPVINYTEVAMSSISTVFQARTILKSNIKNLTAERALFARYLVHLVGDIHQPLHSVSLFNHTFPNGDRGGNLLKLKILNGTTQNLHSFWDAGAFRLQNNSYTFVRPMNLQNMTEMKRLAQSMIDTYGKEVQQLGKIIDPTIWAKQSFLIAQNTTYPFMMKSTIANQDYTNLAHQTSKRRITLAGYRLANFVVDIYNTKKTQSNQQDLTSDLQKIQKSLFAMVQQNQGSLYVSSIRNKNLETQ